MCVCCGAVPSKTKVGLSDLHLGTHCAGPAVPGRHRAPPKKAPCQALLHVPHPGPNGNGIFLLLPGTVAGAAAENILGGAPSPSITH